QRATKRAAPPETQVTPGSGGVSLPRQGLLTHMSVTTESRTVVEMRRITIRFPGVLALDAVDFCLRAGEVHALMGENGAGKSTLIKALTGVYSIDHGTMAVGGEERVFGSAADAQGAGISTVYQEINLCPNLSVGENVMLGHEPRSLR